MSKNITNHKLITTVDPKTGDFLLQDEWVETRVERKHKEKGYHLVHLFHLKDVLLELGSSKAIYIVLDLLSEEVSIDFTLITNYKKISQVYNFSEVYSKKLLKKMKDLGVLKGSRGVYKVNPFLVIPKGATDRLITYHQNKWHNLTPNGHTTPIVSVDEAYEEEDIDLPLDEELI